MSRYNSGNSMSINCTNRIHSSQQDFCDEKKFNFDATKLASRFSIISISICYIKSILQHRGALRKLFSRSSLNFEFNPLFVSHKYYKNKC